MTMTMTMTKRRKREMHGQTTGGKQSPTYTSWCHMHRRCRDRRSKDFPYYGARGIRVCRRWFRFSAFLADMGTRLEGHTLDRIDNAKGYEPGNVRWATRALQAQNRSASALMVTFRGLTLSLHTWCQRLGLSYATVQRRLHRGWTPERAFARPVVLPRGVFLLS